MDIGLSFGAVGDLISIALLTKDVVRALDDCRGSTKEYRDLGQELESLECTLSIVEQTFHDPQIIEALNDLSSMVSNLVQRIRNCLHEILDQIRKYGPSLGGTSSSHGLKNIRRKLQWQLEKKEVDKLRSEISGCTMLLQVLLDITTVRTLQRNHDSLIRHQCDAQNRSTTTIRKPIRALGRSLDMLERRIVPKLAYLSNLSTGLKRSTGQIINMMLVVSKGLSTIEAIVTRLDKGVSDEHFLLEDVTGRVLPMHLKTITSWDVFQFILTERFRGKRGGRRIRRKLYSLQEEATQQEVDMSIDWESAFQPYQRVNMSIICKEKSQETDNSVSTCPFCQTASEGETGSEIQCGKCQRFFRRVVEVDENKTLPQTFSPSSRSLGAQLDIIPTLQHVSRLPKTTCDKCHQNILSESESDMSSDHEDVTSFKRITLVSMRGRNVGLNPTTETEMRAFETSSSLRASSDINSHYYSLATLLPPCASKPAVAMAFEAARIAARYDFDFVYVVRLWPNNIRYGSSCSPRGGLSTHPNLREIAPEAISARLLTAYGLEHVEIPFQISLTVHMKILRTRGWTEFRAKEMVAHQFCRGYAHAFYPPKDPARDFVVTTSSPSSAKARGTNGGIVFVAYRKPRAGRSIAAVSSSPAELINVLNDVKLLVNMSIDA